jgi:hypothetical protein
MTRFDFSPDERNKLIFLRENRGEEVSLIKSCSFPAKLVCGAGSQSAGCPFSWQACDQEFPAEYKTAGLQTT